MILIYCKKRNNNNKEHTYRFYLLKKFKECLFFFSTERKLHTLALGTILRLLLTKKIFYLPPKWLHLQKNVIDERQSIHTLE